MSERRTLIVAFAVMLTLLLGGVWIIDTHSPPTFTYVRSGCVIEIEKPNLFGADREIGRVCDLDDD